MAVITSTINELINLIILTSAQLTTQSLKNAKLAIHISDQNLNTHTTPELSGEALHCKLSWNKMALVDDVMDVFGGTVAIQKQWVELYKRCEISHDPCFVFISSYAPNSQSVRKLIVSDKGVKMIESHESTDIKENLFQIFTPHFILNSIDSNSSKIFDSIKEILHFHSIISPKLNTSLELTHEGSLVLNWTHERIICPFNYYQLGKYFTNDVDSFRKCHTPNVNSYITPPNYRRLAKPQTICVENCKKCRWKIFFLACLLPPLKTRSKILGDDLLDVNVILIGPNNTLLFTPETAPVLPPKTWVKWGKFSVKLVNKSNSNSPIISSLYYVNNLEGITADNTLVLLVGLDLDPSEQDFSKKADSLHFLTSNFTEIVEANENFIQSSCENLLSKLIQNQSIVKTKQDDSFLLGELCNAINSIVHRSTNPEVKADYLNTLQTNSLEQTHDILHQKLISNFEDHLQQFEPNSESNDKRGNQFTPTQPKRQVTDQAFEALEHYNEEEDYTYLQEIPLTHEKCQFSPFTSLTSRNSISQIKSPDSNSLLKSPLFDASSLPPTPQKPEKHSQSSGNTEFNALAEEFSSPLVSAYTPNIDILSPKNIEISPPNITNTSLPNYFENKPNSQNSACMDSSQDFRILCNEELLFSPSATHTLPLFQLNDSPRPRVCLSSQADYEELAREM